ncbi:hypothetical protein Vretimale_12395, partial [Volvox reticuliferus]
GLAMQAAVASSTEALVAAASRPGCAAAAAWVLHGLYLVASSAGGAFVPRVKTSLQLGQELIVSSFDSPALRAACARLANASVAVLGPEFSLGSLAYIRAKSLVAASGGGQLIASEGQDDGDLRHRGGSGADGGLGLVLFVQQIILFAPHAVPPAKHVSLLLSHLPSSQPDLRAASALTLRHLAERSGEALNPSEAAPMLFAALDREGDVRIAGQLRATITTVLKASAGSAPSYWLELLSDVVFAAGPSPSTAASGGGAGDAPCGGDDDDDGNYGASARAPSSGGAGPKGSGRPSGGKNIRSVREVLTAPHLRTRHFAAGCLLKLVRECVASDERHRDSSVLEWQAANRTASTGGAGGHGGRRDLLIAKLQVLVDLGFKLATCPLESLRPHGVRMLTLLVKLFGDVPDPLLPGARLMEQYQAQVVSALRSSLGARQAAGGGLPGFSNHSSGGAAGPGAQGSIDTVQHPLLQIAGGVLATCFLESGLAAGDAVVMRRLMELLSAPLSAWRTLRYESYAEWVGARARVELLRAHAQCSSIAAAAAARGDALCAGIVAKAQEPHVARLQALYAMLLQDHVMLCSQPEAVLTAYRSQLLEGNALPEAATAATTATAEGDGVGVLKEGDAGAEMQKEEPTAGGGAEPGFGLTPAVAAVLRPVYAAACPAVLAALAGRLLPPAELLANPAARTQFRRLLEVGLMLLSDAAARLAHAVYEATRGAAATAASALSQGSVASSILPAHGTLEATAADFSQLRDAATRLAGVLRALQRFLSADYLTALVGAAPVINGQGAVKINGDAATTVSIAPTAAGEPLVPPAVLHDLLQYLGAAAFHAFMPLHRALLEEVVPPSLGTLLAGLTLLCSSLVREVCAAAPEQILSSRNGAGDDNSSHADTEDGYVCGHGDAAADPQPCQGSATGDRPGAREEGWMAQAARTVLGSSSDRLRDSAEARCGSVSGVSGTETVISAATETILLLASACAPYSYGPQQLARLTQSDFEYRIASSSGCCAADSHAAISCLRPPYMGRPSNVRAGRIGNTGSGDGSSTATISFDDFPGCVPLSSLSSEASAGLTQCVVQVLAAAQQLIRRASWGSLVPHVGPLLELPLRLILTSAPGTPVIAAAQRYLDTTTTALLARPVARSVTNGAQATVPASACAAGAWDSPSPAVLAGAAVVALADATELHLRALQSLGRPDSGIDGRDAAATLAMVEVNEDNDAMRLQGRLAALISTLVTCSAAFEAAEPFGGLQLGNTPVTTPIPSPSKGAIPTLGRVGSSSSGSNGGSSGFAALTLQQQPQQRGTRSSLSTGSGSSSRLATSHKAAGAFAAPQPANLGTAPSASMPSNHCRLDQASVRECVLAVLMGAFQSAVPLATALSVLDAVRTAAQEAVGEDPVSPRGRWVRTLVCSLLPLAVERVAVLLAITKPLTGADQLLVAECLKLLVLAATLASPQGVMALDGVMQVLVPLLVEVAAPAAGPAAATPALRDMAVKLITSLPTTASGTAFKAQLAAQSAAARLRLQGALREAAASAAASTTATTAANGSTVVAAGAAGATASAGSVASGSAAQPQVGPMGLGGSSGRTRPTIQLKTTFALPLPSK